MINYRILDTNEGHIAIIFEDDICKRIVLPQSKKNLIGTVKSIFPEAKQSTEGVDNVVSFLTGFFKGKNVTISMEQMDTTLCSPFQLQVLEAERSIPRGKTASYSWVARTIGTKAVRAVGTALATNPFPFVVPCHRSVRMDGSVGKYQGGTDMKRRILRMEGVTFKENGKVTQECFLA